MFFWFDINQAREKNLENIIIKQKIHLSNTNQIIPSIYHSPFVLLPPPLLRIEDDKKNQYVMTLTKFPLFINNKTLKCYESSTPINYVQPTNKDSFEIQFYPYSIFVNHNQFYWLNRSNNQLTIDKYSLELFVNKSTNTEQLQFNKIAHFNIGTMIDYQLDEMISGDLFNDLLIVSNNRKITAIKLDELSILWEKEFTKEWKIGSLKQLDDQMLVYELVNLEEFPNIKDLVVKGVNSLTGEEVWQNEIPSLSTYIMPIHYTFDNSLLHIDTNQQSNGFIGIYSSWKIYVFSNKGQLLRVSQLPKPNKETGNMNGINWHPITYNSDYSILNNTIYFSFAGLESVEIVAYDFFTDTFRSLFKKLSTKDETLWLNPFQVKNEVLLLETVASSKENRKCGRICKILFKSNYDLNYLSTIHDFNPDFYSDLLYASNPIPISNSFFVFLTSSRLVYICELEIKKH